MNGPSERQSELFELLELMFEQRIEPAQFARLEDLIRNDAVLRRAYREYVDLHGLLHWDTAAGAGAAPAGPSVTEAPTTRQSTAAPAASAEAAMFSRQTARAWRKAFPVAAAACLLAVSCLALLMQAVPWPGVDNGGNRPGVPLAGTDEHSAPSGTQVSPIGPELPVSPLPRTDGPVRIQGPPRDLAANTPADGAVAGSPDLPPVVPDPASTGQPGSGRVLTSSDDLVALIDEQIRQSWEDAEVTPSPRADDAEWLRRVSLDIVGHIPTAERVRTFLADTRPDKRAIVVDELLDDEDYVRNWTTIWTNLTIGRSNPRQVNRPALQKFLRESFARNRGWNEIVTEFISANGSYEENGATNFLLAHLNNQAVPATAITAKLFLGLQLQCMQCHDHPFTDETQDQFWAFNSFFQQVQVQSAPVGNDRMDVRLTDAGSFGPTTYETRNGVMKATYPGFAGARFRPDPDDQQDHVDLRAELALLLTRGEAPQMARAFVNRMWAHFMGAGFTPVVDDMGSHVAVSHPELLDHLTREFVHSGYDVKQLIRWVCRSEAYSLTSRFNSGNQLDDPAQGYDPLFSRVYVKPMTGEQLFDSLLIATNAREVFGADWDTVERRRQEWLQQFVMAWNTDENDEADLFDGTIPQALMLMNGELIEMSLSSGRSTSFDRITRSGLSEAEQIEAISLTALSRRPSRQEIAAVRGVIREEVTSRPRGSDPALAMQGGMRDFFWACLNSNEFILIH